MKITTFWHMPLPQKKMFLTNLWLCSSARVTTAILPYHKLSSYFGHPCRMLVASTILSSEQIQQTLQIKRMIALAVRYLPWHLNCLAQAFVAKRWCHHHQIPYFFFIGFTKSSQKPLGKEGHAWVSAGPIVITGGHNLSAYQVVLTYSNYNFQG